MNYQSTTGKTIEQSFHEFDQANPKVYELFKSYTKELIKKKGWSKECGLPEGFKTSAKLIINRIRWEMYIETVSGDGFRINDAFTAYYARKFANDYPAFKDIFNYRELRSN